MKPSSTQIQLFKHKVIYDSLRLTIPGFWNIPQPRKSRIPKQKKKKSNTGFPESKTFFLELQRHFSNCDWSSLLYSFSRTEETIFMYTNTSRESFSISMMKHYSASNLVKLSCGYQISSINANYWQKFSN